MAFYAPVLHFKDEFKFVNKRLLLLMFNPVLHASLLLVLLLKKVLVQICLNMPGFFYFYIPTTVTDVPAIILL
jgi:hypothetical protein